MPDNGLYMDGVAGLDAIARKRSVAFAERSRSTTFAFHAQGEALLLSISANELRHRFNPKQGRTGEYRHSVMPLSAIASKQTVRIVILSSSQSLYRLTCVA